jgi:ABC-type glycerol-3-phosphate transport system substrate-binding protein
MKKTIKLALSVILILSVTLIIFACGSDTDAPTGDGTVITPDSVTPGGDAAADAEQGEILPPFPHDAADWGGETFKILIDMQWRANNLNIEDYNIEEMNGEVLNDAILTRNGIIEDMFNLKIEGFQRDDDMETFVNRLMRAGEDEYHAFAPRLMNASKFAANGHGVNVHETSLTLDAPWWDQNIVNDTSIGGAAYFFAGDIFTYHYDGIALLKFNKKLLADHGMPSPYQFVRDNQWTMDQFNSMVRGFYRDLNQNGQMDRHDLYGFVTQIDYVTSFINASGERFVSKDSGDMPFFTGATEKITNILDKMNEVYLEDTYCRHRNAYGRESGSDELVHMWVFPEGRSLFFWGFPRFIELGLRGMDDDYGIIPIPKWDSNQDRYYATVNNWHSYTFMIPATVADVEKNSVVLDAMAYHGRQLILPAYYDVNLQRKHSRDEESSDMLDIIFASTFYDIGTVYDIGGWTDAVQGALENNRLNVASLHERNISRIERDLGRLIENFERAADR